MPVISIACILELLCCDVTYTYEHFNHQIVVTNWIKSELGRIV